REGAVTYAESPKFLDQALASSASVIIVPAETAAAADARGKTLIGVKNPRGAFARAVSIFHPPQRFKPGVHPTAVIGNGIQLGAEAHVGAQAVIKDNVRIGARSAIDAGVIIGEGSVIGDDCIVYPRVTIYHRVAIGNRVIIHAGAV